MTNNSDRLDQIEQILERSTQLLGEIAQNQGQIVQTQGQIVQIQERQQEQIQTLVNTALNHESRIARQDALIERQGCHHLCGWFTERGAAAMTTKHNHKELSL